MKRTCWVLAAAILTATAALHGSRGVREASVV
jgi:hypothetical protein